MMARMKTLVGIMLTLAATLTQALTWDQYLAQKRAVVSDPKHLPYLMDHGHRTPRCVVLIHGTYASPLYFRSMAQSFFEAGHNVVTLLLPGHFEKDLQSLDRVKARDFIAEADKGYELAQAYGDQVIFAGHSLGALLGIEQSLKRPAEKVAGLMLVAPAVKLWPAVVAAANTGTWLGVSGNTFTRRAPNGVDVPYFGTRVAKEIEAINAKVQKRTLPRPFYVAYTWDDILVDVPYLKQWLKRQTAPHLTRGYPLWERIDHGSISTAPSGPVTYGNGSNPHFFEMMGEAQEFLDRQN